MRAADDFGCFPAIGMLPSQCYPPQRLACLQLGFFVDFEVIQCSDPGYNQDKNMTIHSPCATTEYYHVKVGCMAAASKAPRQLAPTHAWGTRCEAACCLQMPTALP